MEGPTISNYEVGYSSHEESEVKKKMGREIWSVGARVTTSK